MVKEAKCQLNVALLVIVVSLLPAFAHADTFSECYRGGDGTEYYRCSASGDREITDIEAQYDSGRHIKIDSARVCIKGHGAYAVLFFRATAMTNSTFDHKRGAWVGVRLRDKEGQELLTNLNVAIATVCNCGGCEIHVANLPEPHLATEILKKTEQVELTVSGARTEACSP